MLAAVLQDGLPCRSRSTRPSPATVRDLHEPAAVSPDLGCGRGSRRRARAARHPLPLCRYRGANARHPRRVAYVHERAAAEAPRTGTTKDWLATRPSSRKPRRAGRLVSSDRAGAPGAIVLGRAAPRPAARRSRQRTSVATSRSVIEPSSECENAATNALRSRFTIAVSDVGVGSSNSPRSGICVATCCSCFVLENLRCEVHEPFPRFAERAFLALRSALTNCGSSRIGRT